MIGKTRPRQGMDESAAIDFENRANDVGNERLYLHA
jgi:hypothetical protein